jgi:hypothetical protein
MLKISAVVVVMLAFALLGFGVAQLLSGFGEVRHVHTTPVGGGGTRPTASPTMVTIDIPGSDISGLPRFPGSIRIGYQQRPQSSVLQTKVTYLTAADLQMVHMFYREVIDANGWTVADIDFSSNQRYFFLLDDDREATVHLTWRPPRVEVTLGLTELLADATPSPTSLPTQTVTPEPTPATPSPSPTLEPTSTPTTPAATPTSEPTPTPTIQPAVPVAPTEPLSEEPDPLTTAPTVDDDDDGGDADDSDDDGDEDEDEDGDEHDE